MYRKLIHRNLSPRSRVIFSAVGLALLLLCGTPNVRAAVTSIGDVLPFDNLLTGNINEGLPTGGNSHTPGTIANPNPIQDNWENNDVIPGYEVVQAGIVVGQKAFGRLDIDGNSQLRYTTLVIGDQGLIGNGQERVGTGFMVITGINSLYNNDPAIYPPGFPANLIDPNDARAVDFGYDLIVGRFGQGQLDIRGGARAEIQDQTIIGDQPGSVGFMLVDGFASSLLTGGFDPGGTARNPMQVGNLGTGTLTISNSGTVVAESVQGGGAGQGDAVAAVIGGGAMEFELRPEAGGSGTVYVTGNGVSDTSGIGSKWILGGTLQIGAYHNVGDSIAVPAPPDEDFAGVTVEYDSTMGRGTLRVSDGGLVSIRRAIGDNPVNNNLLRMVLGKFGRLELDNGTVSVGEPGTRTDTVAIMNDGVITGSGRIDTGRFWNRYFGRVLVGAGEKLIVDASSEFELPTGGGVTDLAPAINFGLMEIVGTEDERAEFEFVRAPNDPIEFNPQTAFLNTYAATPLLPTPGFFDGGMISAQWATLRFNTGINPPGPTDVTGPGLINEGVLAFTAGTNIISGYVLTRNNAAGALAFVLIDPGTTVIVEDDFSIDPGTGSPAIPPVGPAILVVGPFGGTLEVLDGSTLTLGGVLNTGVSLSRPSEINAGGDIGLSGILNVSLDSDVLASLTHGSSYPLISFGGEAFGVDVEESGLVGPSDTPLAEGSSGFKEVHVSADLDTLFPNLDAITQRIGQGIFLTFLDPSQVGMGASGADFNGDGMVDNGDLTVWMANVGITANASVLQGDGDADGDVDGDDFLYWQRRVGMTSAAAAALEPQSNVPEPSALVLVLCGVWTLVSGRRRRAA